MLKVPWGVLMEPELRKVQRITTERQRWGPNPRFLKNMWFGDLIPGALGIWSSGSQRVGWGLFQYCFYKNQIFFASFTVISHEDSAEFSRGYMCDGVIALPANGFSA